MIKTIFFSFLVIFLLDYPVLTQSITNINILQDDDTLTIEYDLNSIDQDISYKISVLISTDGGATYSLSPITARGDIGSGITPGLKKKIFWEPLKDNIEIEGDNIVVKVTGDLPLIPENIEFIRIKGGTFEMGDNFSEGNKDETPVHTVTLSDFEISKYEVTVKQFVRFLNEYGSDRVKEGPFINKMLVSEVIEGISQNGYKWSYPANIENYPMTNVTWFGAVEFCRYYKYDLPTEAQWEYAARAGGKKVRFGNSKDMATSKDMNYDTQSSEGLPYSQPGPFKNKVLRVGLFDPNEAGLHDMSGNVAEWCIDWYDNSYYEDSEKDNPAGPYFGSKRVIRGGSYLSSAKEIRAASRKAVSPSANSGDIGFRVVKNR